MGFADRFRRLEIPEDKRRVDWSFLDAPLGLPAPYPLADEPLFILMNDRSWIPRPRPAAAGEPSLLLYRDADALEEAAPPARLEEAWRARHEATLAREGRRFLASVPTSVLRDAELSREAREILRLSVGERPLQEDEPSFTRLAADARLLRIHGKLYDLVTLRDYVGIFERAIAPDCFRFLRSLPATVSPEEMLVRIEERLGDIHAKARSPLRNKMSTARATIDGVTYLPVYREEASAMFEAFARLADRRLKLSLLASGASG